MSKPIVVTCELAVADVHAEQTQIQTDTRQWLCVTTATLLLHTEKWMPDIQEHTMS